MDEIIMMPIGYIESKFKTLEQIPRQSIYASKERAKIVLKEEYAEGLSKIERIQHIIILFQFHMSKGYTLLMHPMNYNGVAGVFSSRSPNRPNPIGMSIVKLLGVKDNVVEFEGVDMLDGTPVLDIKPYNEDLNPLV